MRMNDTIIACATAAGFSPRAIVRLSGPRAFEVVGVLASASEQGAGAAGHLSRGLAKGRIVLGGGASFACMVAAFPAPGSYTGEDVVEFFVPGNPHLVERIMRLAIERVDGVRLATPGEFTARAYFNKRLTLEQAEGVAALIAAQNASELAEAGRLLSGARGKAYERFADEVTTLLALVEAGIDFTDQEDVVAIEPSKLAARAGELSREMRGLLGGPAEAAERHGDVRAILVGAANAGKSTLLNALLGRARAVVSPIAGTTRDVLEEPLDLSRECVAGGSVILCDSPGVEAGEGSAVYLETQRTMREAAGVADILIWCDPTGRFEGGVPGGGAGRVIRVRTKADLPAGKRAKGDFFEVSALSGYHIGVLRRAIADAAAGGAVRGGVLPRHRRALRAAAAALEGVERAASSGVYAPEIVAGGLREALDALGELTGRITPDDVIGRVFATFCVGK
ncbi:MAG: GTPase [Phycisphaerales bacterium]|nr:50S ribosome-binding GTPase [Planctomycetota bacterium]